MVEIKYNPNWLKSERVYIWGAGKRGELVFKRLELDGVCVVGFVDSDPQKNGCQFCGKQIVSFDVLKSLGFDSNSVFVITPVSSDEIIAELRRIDAHHVLFADEILYYYPMKFNEEDYSDAKPFNNYESPYPNIVEIHNNEERIFDVDKDVLDIDFNIKRQIELAMQMENIEPIPWGDSSGYYRYHYGNPWFDKWCADPLHYLIRIIKPKRIIEIGSGFSTAVMLDTNNVFFDNSIEIISIEPNADRLKSIINTDDNLTIYEKNLQEIPLGFFDTLDADDFLFVDSSHVSRIDSDVNYLFFEILPRLKRHVYVHFHDIFWPFIYPKKWVYEGRTYNEMYILRAFLMNNDNWSIQYFGEMLAKTFADRIGEKTKKFGGSIWIRKE